MKQPQHSFAMDSSQHEPRRLSALYQYHNAPEVAPAHGLEYDDTNYPSSDKYPVVHAAPYKGAEYTGKHAYQDNRPPRIIFGMKIRTFLWVAAVMSLIIIGAAVGGAVGGKSMRENQAATATLGGVESASVASSPSPSPTTASRYSAPTPTYVPLSNCPAENNTLYTSSLASDQTSTEASTAGLDFTKHCDVASPLSQTDATTLSEAFVYSFSDCVEICAALNFWASDSKCSVAVYKFDGDRPGNCFVGYTANATSPSSLDSKDGTAVALLDL